MVLTVEPGLYISNRLPIPEGQPPIPDNWQGIGIRIEDDSKARRGQERRVRRFLDRHIRYRSIPAPSP